MQQCFYLLQRTILLNVISFLSLAQSHKQKVTCCWLPFDKDKQHHSSLNSKKQKNKKTFSKAQLIQLKFQADMRYQQHHIVQFAEGRQHCHKTQQLL